VSARALLAAAAVLAAAPPAAARGVPAPAGPAADEAPPRLGPIVSLRVGYGIPFGDRVPDQPLRDLVTFEIPIRLQLDYRFTRRLRAGLFLGSVAASRCAAGSGCGASTIRVGIEGQVHLLPDAIVDPWLGVGVAAEVLQADAFVPGEASSSNLTWSGWEAPTVGAGFDVAFTRSFALGPWAELAAGQYTRGPHGSLPSRAWHAWLQVGVKASLAL
jgi:hypothetical protein